ncbi:MAG: IMP cyclohydrolase [Candidatus Aenigmatarchaeota archaeon]
MVYHGRMPVAYVTPSGNPAAGYLVQMRSLPNKKRKFVPQGDRLWLAPIDPADWEKPDADLIFYNTMLIRPDGILAVTNGAQTDKGMKRGKPVLNFEHDFSCRYPEMTSRSIMHSWGYEPDSMSTPRVALVVSPTISDPSSCSYLFSTATRTEPVCDDDIGVIAHGFYYRDIIMERNGIGLPTYRSADGQAVSLSLYDDMEFLGSLIRVPLTGETPEEIAQSLFDFSDPSLIVASAGAVFRDDVWRIAHKNRFETLDEFEAYRSEVEVAQKK